MTQSSHNSIDSNPSPHRGAADACARRSRLRALSLGLAGTVVLGIGALASSGCGSTTTTVQRNAPAAAVLAITSPSRASVLSSEQVTVRGTVTPADAAVEVQGQPAAVGNGVFTGTATLHGGKTTIDVIASAPGTAPASRSVVVTRPGKSTIARVSAPPAQPSKTYVPYTGGYSGQSSCGGGLSVGPNTTCAFAENVRSAYDDSGSGIVMAYSPVTNRTYEMSCSGGGTVVCTGGVGASVYFSGGVIHYGGSRPGYVESTPPAAHAGSYSGYSGQSSCGGGLSVGANTTCAFAENVRSAYDQSGPGTVMAYSPVTNRTYAMTCNGSGSVVCTGADHASVYFP